jgi:hypothetical protein
MIAPTWGGIRLLGGTLATPPVVNLAILHVTGGKGTLPQLLRVDAPTIILVIVWRRYVLVWRRYVLLVRRRNKVDRNRREGRKSDRNGQRHRPTVASHLAKTAAPIDPRQGTRGPRCRKLGEVGDIPC